MGTGSSRATEFAQSKCVSKRLQPTTHKCSSIGQNTNPKHSHMFNYCFQHVLLIKGRVNRPLAVQPGLLGDKQRQTSKPCVLLRKEEGSRMADTSTVPRGTHAVIQRHGVCTVNARGLPTVTPGLTHFRDSYGSRKG